MIKSNIEFDLRKKLFEILPKKNITIFELKNAEKSLEDAFIALVDTNTKEREEQEKAEQLKEKEKAEQEEITKAKEKEAKKEGKNKTKEKLKKEEQTKTKEKKQKGGKE